MDNKYRLKIDRDAVLELYNIGHGVFFPITGFLSRKDYQCVVNEMHLLNGQPWTIPITLEAPESEVNTITKYEEIDLVFDDEKEPLAVMFVDDIFRVDYENDILKVFNTNDTAHPGVRKELSRSQYRIGGAVKILKEDGNISLPHAMTPEESRGLFKKNGWKTIAGFQTRNPIHRAHEYLQRLAMEVVDGLFLQPLIGWKKDGDISIAAIVASYERMIENYYPKNKVLFGTLTTPMRYAGPREAVFHAIVRRNFGCTHFIVGRDHAGVGNYYGKYEAQEFCRQFSDLGVKILEFCGPYYCRLCDGIVTEKTCSHGEDHMLQVSGTGVRDLLSRSIRPSKEYMREDIADLLIELNRRGDLFVKGE